MPTTIVSRIFLSFLLLSMSINFKIYRYTVLPLVMSVKLGLSNKGKSMGWGYSRTECWGRYLGLIGEWRRLHNEELHGLYCPPKGLWAGHVACMGKRGGAYEILVENVKGVGHLEDLGIDKWIILKCMVRKQDGKLCTGFNWLRIRWGTRGKLLWIQNCNIQVLMKCGNFLTRHGSLSF